LAVVAVLLGLSAPASAGDESILYASLGDSTRSPIGWVEFCADNPGECRGGTSQPRDIVMSRAACEIYWGQPLVNETVKPMTDMDHWGVIEKWSLPTDGYGDCEDYVLLKRKVLIDAGWPREALLITVVRDKKGEGHAVLTVKTDKGEFILDNQNENVVAWTETVTASSSVSRRAIRMCGSRLATAALAVATASARGTRQITRQIGDPRPGHIPPLRPRPDRARPALPQGLAATLFALP